MTGKRLYELRKEYGNTALLESNTPTNPYVLFHKWMEAALEVKIPESNAMVLSTSGEDGQVSSRVVLLKEYSEAGFTFFSNYESRKGQEMALNHRVSLLFYWEAMQRQIRIEGSIEKVSADISDEYFATRPEDSRISAIVSPQSKIVRDRAELEERWIETYENARGKTISRPSAWGGYLVVPHRIEFWQGRKNRLHDRLEYRKEGIDWTKYRLAP